MSLAVEPGVIEPTVERVSAPTLVQLSSLCTAWRDAAVPAIWKSLSVIKWPWLQHLPLRDCNWKQRYATLSKCGREIGGPGVGLPFDLADYEFVITARLAKPTTAANEENPILFTCSAACDPDGIGSERDYVNEMLHGMVTAIGHPTVGTAALEATLTSPLALPEGLLSFVNDDDGNSRVDGMQPLHFVVHAHHVPSSKVAHMFGFQVPDVEYPYETDCLTEHYNAERALLPEPTFYTLEAGVGAGNWKERHYRVAQGGGCRFEPPPWLSSIGATYPAANASTNAVDHGDHRVPGHTSDEYMVEVDLELDDERRLIGVKVVPRRCGRRAFDEEADEEADPFSEGAYFNIPLLLTDLPAVCQDLQWA